MKILLDTNAWLWFVLGDSQLSDAARQAILDPLNTKFVSAASCWELSIKINIGKYVLPNPYFDFMKHGIAGNGFTFLPIELVHTEQASRLMFPANQHRDPFDRLLISQAIVENMTIISSDKKFNSYSVTTIW